MEKVLKYTLLVIFGGSGVFILIADAFTDREMFWREMASINSAIGRSGTFLLLGIFLLGVVAAIDWYWQRRKTHKGAGIVAMVVLVGASLIVYALVSPGRAKSQALGALVATSEDVAVAVTRQPAQGLTDDTWDSALLKYQEGFISNEAATNAKQAFLRAGGSEAMWQPATEATSRFVELQGRKLAIIEWRLVIGSVTARSLRVMGLINGEAVSVGCMRQADKPISPFTGACGEKVTQVFGISIGR
jgi:hypothetical protein